MRALAVQALLSGASFTLGGLRFQPFDKLLPTGYHPPHACNCSSQDGSFARRLAPRRQTRAQAPPLGVSPHPSRAKSDAPYDPDAFLARFYTTPVVGGGKLVSAEARQSGVQRASPEF